ncbi:ABC transporter permease [Phycicoccus sp. CSK15P-2]|uniref:ABC transporter permease n=1 Tax=Phycicoccus sp. CSK15P-2 TaxID=2807627 RepID=UPI00195218A8|nr:ABC transporter permease [Phycicoccus sp. CSK15P-2]MBM6403279.1 ABC transporter permease [Phycicoccus sp. CSK15P-2]
MNAVRFEWVKLRSLRSSWLTVAATVLSAAALGVLGISDVLGSSPAELPADWDPTAVGFKGFLFAQLLIGMLGALTIAPEYASGVIAGSLVVVPSRTRLLAAKAVVVGCVAAATALATTLVSFGVVQALLAADGLPAASLGDPGVLRALAGGTFYLTAVGLGGLAVGVVARSATTSLAALVGALLLFPALAPGIVGESLAPYWPVTAAQSAYATVQVAGTATATVGVLLLTWQVVGLSLAGYIAFRRRDVHEA